LFDEVYHGSELEKESGLGERLLAEAREDRDNCVYMGLFDDGTVTELNDLRLGQSNGQHFFDAELRETFIVE
jgi:hypothetical protein